MIGVHGITQKDKTKPGLGGQKTNKQKRAENASWEKAQI